MVAALEIAGVNVRASDIGTVSEGSGASAAFTSGDPVLAQARALLQEGQFSQADAVLGSANVRDRQAADELREVMARVRYDYSLDAAAMLERLRSSIPGVTAADVERWRAAGQLQSRRIDDRVQFFRREPANLFRFCPEAIARRTRTRPEESAWKLDVYLSRVIDAAAVAGSVRVLPVRQTVRYTVTVAADAPGLKPGGLVRAWLPYPQEYRTQSNVKMIATSPGFKVLAPTSDGDRGAAQRSAYFETREAEPGKPLTFQEEFQFNSSSFYPALDGVRADPLPADWAGGGTGQRPPHIVFTPKLSEVAASIVAGETDALARARRIFRHVTRHVAYCAEAEYGTIPNLSDKCLSSGRGDCGVQTMLFITLCRAAGIPARWQSGWQTRPDNGPDMHDWCEFYIIPRLDAASPAAKAWDSLRDRWGGVWLPADVTYGGETRDNPDPRFRDFHFGHLDAYRLVVNRDYGADLVPPKKSFRSEPLDFQRGEVEIDGKNLYFPYWDYEMKVERHDMAS